MLSALSSEIARARACATKNRGHQQPWRTIGLSSALDLLIDGLQSSSREPLVIAIGPPDQGMGVEQDQARASQSFSPTGANGSSKRRTEPRNNSREWSLKWDFETCRCGESGVSGSGTGAESIAISMCPWT